MTFFDLMGVHVRCPYYSSQWQIGDNGGPDKELRRRSKPKDAQTTWKRKLCQHLHVHSQLSLTFSTVFS